LKTTVLFADDPPIRARRRLAVFFEFEFLFDFRVCAAVQRLFLRALATVGGASAKNDHATTVETVPKVDIVHLLVPETALAIG
jgi:hypothetical protein